MAVLAGDYYAECHELFRHATNQQRLMLAEIRPRYQGAASLSILSVGAGVGLFEMPMLDLLFGQGVNITKFVGNDFDSYACKVLRQKLENKYRDDFVYEVVAVPFEDFFSKDRFDLILFNHVFEYIPGNHLKLLKKAQWLLADGGHILLFSPSKPGINKIYAETFHHLHGYSPVFAGEIGEILIKGDIPFKKKKIMGECDISLFKEAMKFHEKLMLLSFLTQIDCRRIPLEKQNEYLEYYLSLRFPGKDTIPHPATMFII